MKKRTTRLLVLLIVLLLSATFIINAFAETIYEYYGLRYTIINNYSVSIYGRTEDSSDDVVFPNKIFDRTVDEIANRAFLNDTELTSVDFSKAKNLLYIGMFAFKGCTSLIGDLVLPDNITYIDTAVFQGCTALTTVTINASISTVPSQMFYQCDSLSSVYLNKNIEAIDSYAFANCPNLAYIEIPRSVERIANSAFQNDDITLGVYYDSAAYLYALDRGIQYDVLDPENIPTEPQTEPATEPATEPETQEPTLDPDEYMLGDADNSGYIDIVDATFVQRYATGINIPDEFKDGFETRADVDSMSGVDSVDATFIMRFIVHINTPYAIGEVFTA